jgi:hypothetical protein
MLFKTTSDLMKMSIVFGLLITAGLLFCQSVGFREEGKDFQGMVKQVDHILLNLENPRELFDFFAQELKLPVVWPYQEYGNAASGGVFAGNVNLEPIFFQGKHETLTTSSRIIGLALEAAMPTEEILKELDRRKIFYMMPETMRLGSEGSKMKIATNTVLEQLLPGSFVFICEYHIYQAFHTDLAQMRKKWKTELIKNDGGPLGIEAVSEIKIRTKNKTEALKNWQNLLKPNACFGGDCIDLGEGPSLRFLDSEQDGIHSLKIKVRSLEKACHFLSAKGLMDAKDKQTVTTKPDKSFGILFEFTEMDSETRRQDR